MHSVMVVDNEPIIRKGLIQCMDWAALDCEVVADAADGLQALDIMGRQPVDILISDVRMPGMDGLALIKEVRRRHPETKVILVTAFSEVSYAQEAVRQQAVDFIIKPTSPEKLRAAVLRAKDLLRGDRQVDKLVQSLKSKQQDNLALEQRLFVEGLLLGKPQSALFVRTQAARLRLKLQGSRVLALRVLEAQGMDEQRLLDCAQEAGDFFSRVFPPEKLLQLPMGPGVFLALVFDMDEAELRALLAEYQGLIEGFAEYSVQVGVSAAVEDETGLAQAATQAQDALFSLVYDERRPCLFYEELPKVSRETAIILQSALRGVRLGFRAQDMKQVEEAMRAFDAQLKQGRLPPQELRGYALLLYNTATGALIDYDLGAALQGGWPKAEQFLQRVETERLPEAFLDLSQEALRLLRGEGRGREGAMQFLQNYIAENLTGELSLEALAKLVHLSPGYLSREFKRTLGQNLSTYISQTRIERAKQLMRSPELKNYEIARLVGIDDPVYFSRAFKKATGLRPSEYRAQEGVED